MLASRFQAARILQLFLVPAESILDASWLAQDWFAPQILVSLHSYLIKCCSASLSTCFPHCPAWLSGFPCDCLLWTSWSILACLGFSFVQQSDSGWVLELVCLRHNLTVNLWHLGSVSDQTPPFIIPRLCLCWSPWPASELTSSPKQPCHTFLKSGPCLVTGHILLRAQANIITSYCFKVLFVLLLPVRLLISPAIP